MILGPDGQPINLTVKHIGQQPITVTRQMKRSYLRVAAMSVINQKAGLELRRIRRSMALTLAKRPAFIAQVRETTHAW